MTVELHLGDCRNFVLSADTVITDPVWPNSPPGLLVGSEDPFGLLESVLLQVEARRLVIVLRSDSDPRFLQAVPKRWTFFRAQILPYVMPGYIGRKLGGDEIAYCFGEPVPSAPGRRVIPGYAPKQQPEGRPPNGHPASRAVGHFRWLVNWWTEPGEKVLDPFMGSGTTGVACVNLGVDFIGIEIDAGYFDIAKKRIEQAQLQVRMPLCPSPPFPFG